MRAMTHHRSAGARVGGERHPAPAAVRLAVLATGSTLDVALVGLDARALEVVGADAHPAARAVTPSFFGYGQLVRSIDATEPLPWPRYSRRRAARSSASSRVRCRARAVAAVRSTRAPLSVAAQPVGRRHRRRHGSSFGGGARAEASGHVLEVGLFRSVPSLSQRRAHSDATGGPATALGVRDGRGRRVRGRGRARRRRRGGWQWRQRRQKPTAARPPGCLGRPAAAEMSARLPTNSFRSILCGLLLAPLGCILAPLGCILAPLGCILALLLCLLALLLLPSPSRHSCPSASSLLFGRLPARPPGLCTCGRHRCLCAPSARPRPLPPFTPFRPLVLRRA